MINSVGTTAADDNDARNGVQAAPLQQHCPYCLSWSSHVFCCRIISHLVEMHAHTIVICVRASCCDVGYCWKNPVISLQVVQGHLCDTQGLSSSLFVSVSSVSNHYSRCHLTTLKGIWNRNPFVGALFMRNLAWLCSPRKGGKNLGACRITSRMK